MSDCAPCAPPDPVLTEVGQESTDMSGLCLNIDTGACANNVGGCCCRGWYKCLHNNAHIRIQQYIAKCIPTRVLLVNMHIARITGSSCHNRLSQNAIHWQGRIARSREEIVQTLGLASNSCFYIANNLARKVVTVTGAGGESTYRHIPLHCNVGVG